MRLEGRGLIDRSAPVSFTFDGVEYEGFEGDTLASALLANGIRLVGRSFKYHRPRGILTAGSEEPNALVTLGHGAARDPNVRATVQELFEGLEAQSQNRWPTLGFDLMELNEMEAGWQQRGTGSALKRTTEVWGFLAQCGLKVVKAGKVVTLAAAVKAKPRTERQATVHLEVVREAAAAPGQPEQELSVDRPERWEEVVVKLPRGVSG